MALYPVAPGYQHSCGAWPPAGNNSRSNSAASCNKLAGKSNPDRHFERAERREAKREISRAYRISYISASQEISRYARNDALILGTNCNKLKLKFRIGAVISEIRQSFKSAVLTAPDNISEPQEICLRRGSSPYGRNDGFISASFSNILTLKASAGGTQEKKYHALVVTTPESDQLDMFPPKIDPKTTTNGNKMQEISRKSDQFWPILIIYDYLCPPKNLLKKEDFKFGRKSNY